MVNNTNTQILEDIFIVDSENIYESQLLQQCFDIVGVFVAAVDLKGNVTLISRKGRHLLGYTNEEIIGQGFIQKFIVEEDHQKIRELFRSMIEEKPDYPEQTKYRICTKNNKIRIIEAKNVAIRDKKNNLLGILISGEDVTGYVKNQHDLQNDLGLYRILANNIPDINLFLFDDNLQFIIAEGVEMQKVGLDRSMFEKKQLSEIPEKKLVTIWEPMFKAAIQGKQIYSEYEYNGYFYLIWVIPVKYNSDIYSGVAIIQNITEDKITEKKLKKSKDEAEKANKAKSEFLARVSHEIRTPLNAILGFTEQLRYTDLDEKQREYVSIIDNSSEHLLSLINDILILSKIEAGQISFESAPFKIGHILDYVYNALAVRAEGKNLRFVYDMDEKLDMVLVGDSFRLRQILINMLNNAIKFTHCGYVELRCFLKEETNDEAYVRFDVIDTGIGISPGNLEVVFEQFRQADATITKKYGGTGLGLTICKNLIEMQNGSLSVTSQENIGTTFTFVLPFKKGKETDIIPEDLGEVDSQKLKNKRVLLVDDDSVNRLLGETILEKFNCNFDIASNGKEAIDKLDSYQYDIVLLDIHMPEISGIDVAKFLRNEKKDRSTKIVAVTAAVMKDDIQNYYKAGINDFLIKPFKEINLFNKMCEMLKIENQSYKQPKAEIILKEELSPRIYNLAELKKMSGNDNEMIVKMLNTFVDNTETAIENMVKHLREENWEKIGETAHKILPSFRHLEVNTITSYLLEIKTKTLISPDYKSLPGIINKTIGLINKLLIQLKEEIDVEN
jgi:PAS domain S-box-containing protein